MAVGLVLALVAPAQAAPVEAAPASAGTRLVVTTTMLPLLDGEGPGGHGRAYDVNDGGQVVGTSGDQPVLWQDGEVVQLMEADPAVGGDALQINDRGQVLVVSGRRSYVWFRGRLAELEGGPGSTRVSGGRLNERGQVLGSYSVGGDTRPVFGVWEPDATFVPITPPDGWIMAVRDLADNGYVAGTLTAPDGSERRPYLWRAGRFTWIGDAGVVGVAVATNRRGQLVGTLVDPDTAPFGRAVLWDRGVEVPLGLPPGPASNAVDINDRGQVIGLAALTPDESIAYLWDDGELVDLGRAGGLPLTPTRINQRGMVVGYTRVDGVFRSFLWDRGDVADLDPGLGPDAVNDRGQAVGATEVDGLPRPVLWTVRPSA